MASASASETVHALVSRDVPFLAKRIERRHDGRVCADRFSKRLDHPVVMGIARRSKARGSERSRGCLQSGIVGDVHPPVGAQALSRTIGEVALDHLQQVADFVSAGLVLRDPTVSLPVREAHCHLR